MICMTITRVRSKSVVIKVRRACVSAINLLVIEIGLDIIPKDVVIYGTGTGGLIKIDPGIYTELQSLMVIGSLRIMYPVMMDPRPSQIHTAGSVDTSKINIEHSKIGNIIISNVHIQMLPLIDITEINCRPSSSGDGVVLNDLVSCRLPKCNACSIVAFIDRK